jgi:catechol 2,3-dioxygenase-like lactoylglutathione lyase family enzyme
MSDGTHTGIPTARSIDHVGISVPDLDEAREFFVDVLGCETVFETTPPIDESTQDWMERNLGVHSDSTMELAKLRCGPNAMVELLDYDDPERREETPTNSDNGAAHLCFQVDDVEAALDYLRDVDGVEIQGEPRTAEEGPEAGQTFVYFTTPWGLQLEIMNTPADTAFLREDTDGWNDDHWLPPAPDWDARPARSE